MPTVPVNRDKRSPQSSRSPNPGGEGTIEAQVGRAIHAVVATLLEDGLLHPTLPELYGAVGRHIGDRRFLSARSSFHDAVLAGAATYFRFFAPAGHWLLVGTELELGDSRADIVWRPQPGNYLVDELKSTAPTSLTPRDATTDQLARQLAGGRTNFGDAFAGIRLLALSAPRRSLFVSPTGALSPLYEETLWLPPSHSPCPKTTARAS